MSTLMIQGCTSDAGKSTLVAGLCRVLARRGQSVAPFKPQNMALNSAVTQNDEVDGGVNGGEIGRAQALQAQAAGIPPSVHMNPVLLKPNSDTGAQVILQGQSIGNLNALDYHQYKPKAAEAVFDSFQKLHQQYPIVLVEGAGSPAEVNLRQGDIANMGFAEEVDCPVILIADIDKGGVFAHIIGTLECLSASERNRIQGFVINRFRGDITLLQDGLDWLEAKTNKPVLGVLPYLHGLHLDAEDAISNSVSNDAQNTEKTPKNSPKTTRPGDFLPEKGLKTASKSQSKLKVICPLLPHIANHTDLDPLIQHPEIEFEWVQHQEDAKAQNLPPADLVILPGSKNIAFDLAWLKSQGWSDYLPRHLRYGGKVIGICGGLQMLGHQITDPEQIESEQTDINGFGLMDYRTQLQPSKTLQQRQGALAFHGSFVKGYEIHQGHTHFDNYTPAIQWQDGTQDGAVSDDNQLFVTYCHGLFDEPTALQSLLEWAGMDAQTKPFDINAHREQQLELLADTLETHLDLTKLMKYLDI